MRCYAYEVAESLLTDIMNLMRVPTESNLGVTAFKYRKHGSTPDDTLHALNFAFTGGRVLLGEPLFEDRGLRQRLDDLLRTGNVGSFGMTSVSVPGLRPFSG